MFFSEAMIIFQTLVEGSREAAFATVRAAIDKATARRATSPDKSSTPGPA
jgi:hypothetical protein